MLSLRKAADLMCKHCQRYTAQLVEAQIRGALDGEVDRLSQVAKHDSGKATACTPQCPRELAMGRVVPVF